MQRVQRNAGFTLVEVLTVVIIIGVLISILIPVVSGVQKRARAAETQSWVSQLSNAITNYYQDFKAYPGPLGNNEIQNPGTNLAYPPVGSPPAFNNFGLPASGAGATDFDLSQGVALVRQQFTMPENLVLGLLGGLKLDATTSPPTLVYDPSIVGTGPNSLNPANPKKYNPYIEPLNLSWRTVNGKKSGRYADDASPGGIQDTIVPEFVDKFSDPMPVLYLRAKRGVSVTANDNDNNPVVTFDRDFTAPNLRSGVYDLSQIISYTESSAGQQPIGVGKKLPEYVSLGAIGSPPNPANAAPAHGLRSVNVNATFEKPPSGGLAYMYPYDAFTYLRNPSLSSPQKQPGTQAGTQVAREKDKFILISAGIDRVYGTNDDITSFGSVAP